MKQNVLTIILAIIMLSGYSQQQPHYTQYMLNSYIINPAVAGIENYTDVKISHRHQWAGLQDAPVTTYFTLHAPLGKNDYRTSPTSFAMPGNNPRGKQYREEYTSAEPHHGIGLKLMNDRTGPLNKFSGYLSYAYHMGLGPRTNLSVGFEAGLQNISLTSSKLVFEPGNPGAWDLAVGNSLYINKIKPDFGMGLWLYGAKYFVGISAQQIIPQKIYFTGHRLKSSTTTTVPHVFASAGYRFFLDDDMSVLPSVMVKYVQPAPPQADMNVKLQYRDLLWAGAGYRMNDGFVAIAGLNISSTLNLAYSYDYTTSNLNAISRGTHEMTIGFLLGNSYGDWCPRHVW